jgi:putative endonuclease
LNNLISGKSGEDIAVGFLGKNGYKILARNYKNKFGEIDVIAKEHGTICFLEVKSRYSKRFGAPQEAVTGRKQRQISRAALCFLKENNLLGSSARFDVVSVISASYTHKIELFKNAFELEQKFSY